MTCGRHSESSLSCRKAEQQGPQRRTVARLAPPDDDAVGGALVLDLHPMSLPRDVGAVPRFRDHSVEARALELLEPILCGLQVAGVRRQEERLLDPLEQLLEALAALSEGQLAQVGLTLGQHVKCDE